VRRAAPACARSQRVNDVALPPRVTHLHPT